LWEIKGGRKIDELPPPSFGIIPQQVNSIISLKIYEAGNSLRFKPGDIYFAINTAPF